MASLLDGAKPCPAAGHQSILTKVVVHHYDNLILIVDNPTIPEGPNNVIVKQFTSL